MKRLTNTGPVLSVSVAGGRGGKVTSSPSGIDCGDTRSAAFTQGTQVTLSATAAAAWGFAGWGAHAAGSPRAVPRQSVPVPARPRFTTLFVAPQVFQPDAAALPPAVLSPLSVAPTAF